MFSVVGPIQTPETCPAFSCPSFSCLDIWSFNFMSVIFSAPVCAYTGGAEKFASIYGILETSGQNFAKFGRWRHWGQWWCVYVLKLEESRSGHSEVKHFSEFTAVTGCVHVDAWASKYYPVNSHLILFPGRLYTAYDIFSILSEPRSFIAWNFCDVVKPTILRLLLLQLGRVV